MNIETKASEVSLAERERLAYKAFEKSSQIRVMRWWHWLLFLSLPTLIFAQLWWQMLVGLYTGEVNFSDPGLWFVLILIPHLWVYPFLFIVMAIRTAINRRVARLMETTKEAQETKFQTSHTANTGDLPPFKLDLISDIPISDVEKQMLTDETNVFGKSPKSFLFLYDFRVGKTLRRHSIPFQLMEYGPVFRMETPMEVSLVRYVQLLNPRVFASVCAVSHAWVLNFLKSADIGALPISRATRPHGRYAEVKFIATDAIWQDAVLLMFEQVDYVVIDARSFTKKSPGLIWEIEAAAELVSTDKIIILADVTTYMPDLEACLRNGWGRRRPRVEQCNGPIRVVRGGVDPQSIKFNKNHGDHPVRNFLFRAQDLVSAGVLP